MSLHYINKIKKDRERELKNLPGKTLTSIQSQKLCSSRWANPPRIFVRLNTVWTPSVAPRKVNANFTPKHYNFFYCYLKWRAILWAGIDYIVNHACDLHCQPSMITEVLMLSFFMFLRSSLSAINDNILFFFLAKSF